MNELQALYNKIEYLRNRGTKMKEIADWVGMAPSVLSSLYTTVMPAYFDSLKTMHPDQALDQALVLVNNISKKRLLGSIEGVLNRLEELEPPTSQASKGNPFVDALSEESLLSCRKITDFCGLYTSYSLSSSSDCLKAEPFIITLSENKESVRIGRLSAYGEAQWGIGVVGDPQNFYCMFSENPVPPLTLVTIYLQLPLFKHPRQLRGLYMGLDYNRNPIARRILLIKESESTDVTDFKQMKSGLIAKADFTPEQQAYYEYTCQAGDHIKMCTVPSLQMNESDLVKEKKMLAL